MKISAPFSNNSATVAPPQQASIFAHEIRGPGSGKSSSKKSSNNKKKQQADNRQRPSTAPHSRHPSSSAQETDCAVNSFRHTYHAKTATRNNSGGGGDVLYDNQDDSEQLDYSITGEGGDKTVYASGSGTNVARSMNAHKNNSKNSSSTQKSTQEVHENEDENNQQEKPELESEELLINKLPAIGLQAYDTLCKVLAHLEPADRVKVVECALIDSSEISKAKRLERKMS